MSRGAFHGGHARHDGDAERIEVDTEHVDEDAQALEGPGQQNSGAARLAEAARDQRRAQRQSEEEREEAPDIVDPRLRELAAAAPPPPPAAEQQRLYTAADGVDSEPGAGVPGAPPGDDHGAGDPAPVPAAPWPLLGAPPPPPPSAPPLDDGWPLIRRDGD